VVSTLRSAAVIGFIERDYRYISVPNKFLTVVCWQGSHTLVEKCLLHRDRTSAHMS
jgi:hypothetical protein